MAHMAAADSRETPLTRPQKPVAVAAVVAAGEGVAKGTARLRGASAQWGSEAAGPGSEVGGPRLEVAGLGLEAAGLGLEAAALQGLGWPQEPPEGRVAGVD